MPQKTFFPSFLMISTHLAHYTYDAEIQLMASILKGNVRQMAHFVADFGNNKCQL